MKKYLKLLSLLLAFSFSLNLLGCSFNTANFSNLQLSTQINEETAEPINPKNTFGVDDANIYLTGTLNNAVEGTIITSYWIYLDLPEEPEYVIDQASIEITDVTTNFFFFLSRPNNGWPEGNYKVELHIDDVFNCEVAFIVE